MKFCYKKIFSSIIILSVFIITADLSSLHAQNQKFYTKNALQNSQKIQKSGMIILGSWAALNFFSGTIGFYSVRGNQKYFHQMNAFWNVVNLGIAGFGYHRARTMDMNFNYESALNEMQNFERILLINATLDLAYIGTGIGLWKRGINKNSDRQIGYGKSLIVQGGFLLAFDLILYTTHSGQTKNLLQITDQLSFNPIGVTFSF